MPYSLNLTKHDVNNLIKITMDSCKPSESNYNRGERPQKYDLQARISVYRDLHLIDDKEYRYYWNLLNYEYDKHT